MAPTEEPAASYYRYTPQNLPSGIYDNPTFGELIPGRIVEVRARHESVVRDNPDWTKASKKQFESQPTITEQRDELRLPRVADEEE
jgi:hypothetical protein